MRLGDLLKLGIPGLVKTVRGAAKGVLFFLLLGQPVERDDGETELEKQMQQFRVQQDHLLRRALNGATSGA